MKVIGRTGIRDSRADGPCNEIRLPHVLSGLLVRRRLPVVTLAVLIAGCGGSQPAVESRSGAQLSDSLAGATGATGAALANALTRATSSSDDTPQTACDTPGYDALVAYVVAAFHDAGEDKRAAHWWVEQSQRCSGEEAQAARVCRIDVVWGERRGCDLSPRKTTCSSGFHFVSAELAHARGSYAYAALEYVALANEYRGELAWGAYYNAALILEDLHRPGLAHRLYGATYQLVDDEWREFVVEAMWRTSLQMYGFDVQRAVDNADGDSALASELIELSDSMFAASSNELGIDTTETQRGELHWQADLFSPPGFSLPTPRDKNQEIIDGCLEHFEPNRVE